MGKSAFSIVASLAILRASERQIKFGWLESESEPTLPLKGWGYLWTFTTPKKISLVEMLERWRQFANSCKPIRSILKGVRVIELSKKRRWHIHFVTVIRYDVNFFRKYAERFAFGRINVKRIPAKKLVYVAKYLKKTMRSEEAKGRRLVAVVGFKGCSAARVRTHDTWREFVYKKVPLSSGMRSGFFDREREAVKRWHLELEMGFNPTTLNEPQGKI